MLVPAFPPGQQCTFRTLKFAKYLPEFGWQPVVLTPRQPPAPRERFADSAPPDVVVVRTARLATPSMRLIALKKHIVQRKSATEASVTPSQEASQEVGDTIATMGRPDLRRRIGTLVRQALLWGDTPDNLVGWIPHALAHGRRLVRRHDVAAIHASGPSFSVVLAGALLSRATGVPLVADFRDTWTLDPSDPFGAIGGGFRNAGVQSRDRVVRQLEAWCLRQASAVLFTSRATQELYETAYPFLQGRAYLIYNGIDPDDLEEFEGTTDVPTFAHVGTVHPYQWPQVRAFLEGFAHARSQNLIPAQARIAFIGPLAGVQGDMERALDELELRDAVLMTGPLPHREAVAWMQRCSTALLFVGENPYIRLSKISELVAAGRPMLAFAPSESETGREVLGYGAVVIENQGTPDLPHLIAESLERGTQTPHSVAHDAIAHPHPLNRRTEAMQLAEILKGISENKETF
jgi:glycosyltransferase involved in cell wall biosynthesis